MLLAVLVVVALVLGIPMAVQRIERLRDAADAPPPGFAVGECTDQSLLVGDGGEHPLTDGIVRVDCALPHRWEAYAEKELNPEDPYPGDVHVVELTDEFCLAAFADFVGLGYEDSQWEATFLHPSEASWHPSPFKPWESADHTITCLIGRHDGGVTGSLRGARS